MLFVILQSIEVHIYFYSAIHLQTPNELVSDSNIKMRSVCVENNAKGEALLSYITFFYPAMRKQIPYKMPPLKSDFTTSKFPILVLGIE